MAEWLGIGLQNRVPRFESGRCLLLKTSQKWEVFFIENNNFKTAHSVLPKLRDGRLLLKTALKWEVFLKNYRIVIITGVILQMEILLL